MDRSLRDELLTIQPGQWITVSDGRDSVTVRAVRRTLYLDCFLVMFPFGHPVRRKASIGIVPFENVEAWGIEPPDKPPEGEQW